MFSVVVPLYNKEQFVSETLRSIQRQTFEDFEIVVINDGSTDGSVEIVAEAARNDSRIRIFDQPNSGVGAARNRGIKVANFDWIAFMDADDIWADTHLSYLNEIVRTYPEADFISTGFTRSLPLDAPFPSNSANSENTIQLTNYFKAAVENPGYFLTSTISVRKTLIDRVGGFGQFQPGQDVELWVRLGLEGQAAMALAKTVFYRTDPNGITGTSKVHVATEGLGRHNLPTPVLSTLDKRWPEVIGTALEPDVTRYFDHRLVLGMRSAILRGDRLRAWKMWRLMRRPFARSALLHMGAMGVPRSILRAYANRRAKRNIASS